MPDIVNNVQTMSLNHTKSYEDDPTAIKLEVNAAFTNQCIENYSQQTENFHFNSLVSKETSTVDMSAIVDPIIINYQLLSMSQKTPINNNNENADSLLNDIDMLS